MDPEWKKLDFQNEVRPEQLDKLDHHQEQIEAIDKKLQSTNDANLL
jgi:hypothetical protein